MTAIKNYKKLNYYLDHLNVYIIHNVKKNGIMTITKYNEKIMKMFQVNFFHKKYT